jgi:hypothetical protein
VRYSGVIAWFGIELSAEDRDLVDMHFTGWAHHGWRWRETDESSSESGFHLALQRLHAEALLRVVHERGLFHHAFNRSGEERHHRAWWDPTWGELPDDDLSEMYSDPRYPVGADHPHDILLSLHTPRKAA